MSISIHPICFSDNFIWCIHNNQHACVVDPGNADVVIGYLESKHLILKDILITHHHSDHTAGIQQLVTHYQNVTVYGPKNASIVGITNTVSEPDSFLLSSLNENVTVVETPGHTLDHISYIMNKHIFCADTLFSGGCGRLFEGSAKQLYSSIQKLLRYPDENLLYCGHEYTLSNLRFAKHIEPNNPDIQGYINHVKALRSQNKASLPTSIELEKKINPFCRAHLPVLKERVAALTQSPLPLENSECFRLLRNLKDSF